jgi:hypothetical protein
MEDFSPELQRVAAGFTELQGKGKR